MTNWRYEPFAFPDGSQYTDRVNVFNDPQTGLLKDVRKVNNIWRYLRDGYLGKYYPLFLRQFYLQYDYLPIGYDSEEEFAYRLAAKLENVEDEYMGRLNSETLIKNPLVNRILQDDNYGVQSERGKAYTKRNDISDAVQLSQQAALGVNARTDQRITNEAEQAARDEHQQKLEQEETMADTSETEHHLNRFSDSPQGEDMVSGLMPIGWTGTAGAIGTDAKNDHYPKAEALVPMPWNEGYLTTGTLDNNARDEHTTSGMENKSDNLVQARRSRIMATEEANLGSNVSRSNNQGVGREQAQSYGDTERTDIQVHDNEQSRQLIGLEGRTVGSVWAEWQDLQKMRNAIGDLCNEARPCFLLVA